MDNILAAQVLRSHLPDIKDGAYKTATENTMVGEYQKQNQKIWQVSSWKR